MGIDGSPSGINFCITFLRPINLATATLAELSPLTGACLTRSPELVVITIPCCIRGICNECDMQLVAAHTVILYG